MMTSTILYPMNSMKINSYNTNHHVLFYKDTRILFSYCVPVAAIFFQGRSTEFGWKLDKLTQASSRMANRFLKDVQHVHVVEEENFNSITL